MAKKQRRYFSLSVPVGGFACNARCKFCVASMTPLNGVTAKAVEPDWDKFRQACAFARKHGVTQIMLTGKGEPTLWPDLVTRHLEAMQPFGFEHIDLQSNAIAIANRKPVTDEHLRRWRELGLTLVAISIVSTDAELNRRTYTPYQKQYIDLANVIADLHKFGFQVRLSVVLLDGFIDDAAKLAELMRFAHENKVEQVTVRPVAKPEESRDDAVTQYVETNFLKADQRASMQAWLDEHAELVRSLPWGGEIYKVSATGQNLCVTNCLTRDDPAVEVGRQLIYFPSGAVSESWEEESVDLLKIGTKTRPTRAQLIQVTTAPRRRTS